MAEKVTEEAEGLLERIQELGVCILDYQGPMSSKLFYLIHQISGFPLWRRTRDD